MLHPVSRQHRWFSAAWLFLSLLAGTHLSRAAVTVLIGEPFGPFGGMMPLGHSAVYLDRLCADGPLHIRMCHAGEPQGVVLARYHALGELDWMASPVMQFLYAADTMDEVLPYATPELVWDRRQAYRHRFLGDLVPDGTERGKSMEEWWESAGVAYNRRLWAYQIDTTPEQDQHFVEAMNARPNHHLYHLKKTNCADFAAEMVNLYFPGTVRNDRVADFGLMTPKQVARCVAAYGARHPEAHLRIWEIPQIPGSLVRSHTVRGGAESGIKSKRYLLSLAVLQPEVPTTLFFLYLAHGRWRVGDGATVAPDLPIQIARIDGLIPQGPAEGETQSAMGARVSQPGLGSGQPSTEAQSDRSSPQSADDQPSSRSISLSTGDNSSLSTPRSAQ